MEPVVDTAAIQGNVFPGFRKPNQVLIGFRIHNSLDFAAWMVAIRPSITSATEVMSFRQRLRETDSEGIPSTIWINIAFTAAGLERFVPDLDGALLPAFRSGYAHSRAQLALEVNPSHPGHPDQWKLHDSGPSDGRACDGILLVAGDSRVATLQRAEDLVRGMRGAAPAGWVNYLQPGREIAQVLGSMWGSSEGAGEHFGFRDGLATPVPRGRMSTAPGDWLVARNPADPERPAKAGHELVWPGWLLVGQPRNDAEAVTGAPLPSAAWLALGSFVIFMRLRQEPHRFHAWVHDVASRWAPQLGEDIRLVAGRVAAGILGRWPSGASTVRTPADDPKRLEDEDLAPLTGTDPDGARCPWSAHVRKVRPNIDHADEAPLPPLFRRGMTYGPRSPSTLDAPFADAVDRGLHFFAYVASIEDQYERLVLDHMAARPGGTGAAGLSDALLGCRDGTRRLVVRYGAEPGQAEIVEAVLSEVAWAYSTGGLFLFAPSLKCLGDLFS
jgi:deferrochelatase/peroxidase EfeB